jgi:predicted DCC family thiol-disulfide oxidoreductase YuxK
VLILFDGVCNLCNGAVQFIIRRDPTLKFRFASLQSDFGRAQLLKFHRDPSVLHSLVVIEHETFFERSDAVLRIARRLGGVWSWIGVFRYIPRVIRDLWYDTVARYRYKIFGRTEACMVPTAEMKVRFVE